MTLDSSLSPNRTDEKVKEIEAILVDPNGIDLWKLREACLSEGGLVHDSLRRRVWPLLVGLPSSVNPYQSMPLGTSTRDLGGGSMRHSLGSVDEDEDEKSLIHPDDNSGRHRSSVSVADVSQHDTISLNASGTFEDMSIGADSATTASRTNSRRRYRRCQDHYQIDLDVARCTWHLLTGDQRAQRYQMEHKRNRQVARIIRRKQRRLGLFINLTLLQSEEERLRYYQGFHDVACIFLTTLASGPTPSSPQSQLSGTPPALELPARVLNQVSQSHLRDYLKDNFVDLQTALRLTVFPMLASLDPYVHDHLYAAEMEPFFCLSWVITWFAHEVRDSALVKRLFDAFLVGHPLLPLYVSIAMVIHPINRQIILETEPDFAILHQTLRGLPRNSSMVGWKYRPGDGYVSDDEEEDDDDDEEEDAAVEARLDAAVDGDIHQLRSVLDKDGTRAPTGATSSVSTGSTTAANASECHARVPFQELMDLALVYMRKIPPRQLLRRARRYYGKAHVEALLKEINSIELMGEVPAWAVQPTLAAETSPKIINRVLREKQKSKAVVALGLGLSDLDRLRRRRLRFWFGVVAVALLAVAVTWWDQSTREQMQRTIGWLDKWNESSDSGACTRESSNVFGTEQLAPGTDGSSMAYVEVSPDGNTMDPVGVKPQAFVEIHNLPPPPARRPVTRPVMDPKSGRPSPAMTPSSESPRSKMRDGWFDSPALKWFRRVSAQERLFRQHMEVLSQNLGNHIDRLLFSRKKARPMIADGDKKRRVARRLKPLHNFLNRPLDEIWHEGKKIASDQARIFMDWLNRPYEFGGKTENHKPA